MGTKPPTPTFEPGVPCIQCEATLFGGVTPKYIEALIQGITTCPTAPPAPNGVSLLTQFTPCFWAGADGGYSISMQYLPGQSVFNINIGVFKSFSSMIMLNCQTLFANQNPPCGVFPAIGTGGTAEIFWGPTIGP